MAQDDDAPLPPSAEAALRDLPTWTDDQLLAFMDAVRKTLTHSMREKCARAMLPCLDIVARVPQELSEKILLYLPVVDLLNAAQVSKTWHRIARSDFVWRRHIDAAMRQSSFWPLFAGSPSTRPAVEAQRVLADRYHYIRQSELQCKVKWERGEARQTVIECGSQGIYCLQYDDRKIVTGNRDHTIKIWGIASRELEDTLRGHEGSVLCLQFDEERIISGSSDSTIRVWDLSTKECRAIFRNHTSSVLHVRFAGDRLISCSKDFTIISWLKDEGGWRYNQVQVLEGHRAAVNVIEFDERYIVSGSGDRTLRVWSTETGQCLRTLSEHSRGIACLHYRGDYIVSGSSDTTIIVWDVHTGRRLRQLSGHTDLVRCIRFDERYIVSGSYDKTIRVWDFHTGRQLCELQGHDHRVFRVQFDALKIISSSQDDRIIIWDFAPQK